MSERRSCAVLPLLLLALGCAGPVAPTATGIEDWLEIRTPAFRLAGDIDEEELRELAANLVIFDAVVRRVTNTRIDAEQVPIHLYVLREGARESRLLPSPFSGVLYRRLSGYYAVLESTDADFATRSVLLHEYAHYVLRGGRRAGLPTWYNEGLCEFLAYTGVRDDVVILGRSATPRLAELDRYGLVPLDELFSDEGYPRDLRGFYATSWALSHHLNTSPELNRSSRVFVARLVRGEDWRAAFDASFTSGLAELESSLAAHVDFLQRGGRRDFGLSLDKLDVEADLSVRTLWPADVAYELGMLMRRVEGDPPDADDLLRMRALFEEAVAADPGNVRARAALAWTWAASGERERAREEIARMGRGGSDDPQVALDRARIAALEAVGSRSPEAWAAATALLERAIALSPSDPETHAALGTHLARQGEHDAAIGAFERARGLGAWSPPLEVALAREYLAAGGRLRARELLRPVAADPHGGETSEVARRLLEKLEGEG